MSAGENATSVLLSQPETPAWRCSHGNSRRTALRAFSSSGFENVSSLRLVFLLSSKDPGSRDPAAVEQSTCPSEGQEPQLETLEAEAAPASKAATRAARLPTLCSTLVTLVVKAVTDCVSDRMLFSNLVNPCTSMGIDASTPRRASDCESFLAKMASSLSSIEPVGRAPTLSRSGTQQSGDTRFEERSCNGELGTFPCSASLNGRRLATKAGGNQQNWVVDTWTRQNQKSS